MTVSDALPSHRGKPRVIETSYASHAQTMDPKETISANKEVDAFTGHVVTGTQP